MSLAAACGLLTFRKMERVVEDKVGGGQQLRELTVLESDLFASQHLQLTSACNPSSEGSSALF